MIYFIGYKAGLLEPLTELRYLILKNNLNVRAICSSNKLDTISKAELTPDKPAYKVKYLKSKTIKNIKTANQLFLYLTVPSF